MGRVNRAEKILRKSYIKAKEGNSWESKLVFNPAVVYHNRLVHLLYRAVGDDNISRIGYAISDNGFEFFRLDKPCEDPRLFIEIEFKAEF